MDGEREKFESVARDEFGLDTYRNTIHPDMYQAMNTQWAWQGYQAGRASLPSAQPSDVVEALRASAIKDDGEGTTECAQCNEWWHTGDEEIHEPKCLAALTTQQAQNTAPLNGGIRQSTEPSDSVTVDSTSRVSLPNNCERGVQAQSVQKLVEAARIVERNRGYVDEDDHDALEDALAPFTANKDLGNG